MTEEPYRWLDAIRNRREYVQSQLLGGTPVFAVSLDAGILLLGVGTGNSKVFEIFDRHALAGLGHPADLERLRQTLIDSAHLEAFERAPEDVTLRRLVSFGLAPQLKLAFEQIFSPPFLSRLLLAEVGSTPAADVLVRLNFDGSFDLRQGGILVATDDPQYQAPLEERLRKQLTAQSTWVAAVPILLEAWWSRTANRDASDAVVDHAAMAAALEGRVVESALLRRGGDRAARYLPLEPPNFASPSGTPPSS